MEQWQFLIQKEGERTWHPLEKPRIQITEGRYRVVARSTRTNTDVEVRVIHSSPSEVPPIRRIQKRKRHINSQGLIAIIPFTYLKPGIWELQCSGDLMSDLIGASWQYTVTLSVIPASVGVKAVSQSKSFNNLHKPYKVGRENISETRSKTKSEIKKAESNRHSSVSSKEFKTNDAGLISSNSIEPVSSKGRTTKGQLNPIAPEIGEKAFLNKPTSVNNTEKLRESLKDASGKQKAVSKKTPTTAAQPKPSASQNRARIEKPAQKLRDSVKKVPSEPISASVLQESSRSNTPALNKNQNQSQHQKSETLNKTVNQKSSKKLKEKTSNQETGKKTPQKGDLAIIEQTPVRVKGDTAEQILQNLIELALPSSESLLPDDEIEETAPPPLPLQLILDRVNYVASWGQTITVEGLIQLKETTDWEITEISQAELLIELRSPQNSQLIQSFRQPNPNKSLPFAIASLINIPEECSSKLILGEIKLYGSLPGSGVVELLASQSFTITAEIKELLAITVANPKGELEKFAYSRNEVTRGNTSQVLEDSVSLDLELLNLVKEKKPEQSKIGVPSTKKSLPPRIDPRKTRRRVASNYLQLPNVPGYQEKIDEYISKGYIETATESGITGTSFPYLRKLKELPLSKIEVDEHIDEFNQVEESIYTKFTENQNATKISTPQDNTSQAELVIDEQKDSDYLIEEDTPQNSELIAEENPNTSPLIRQWMLSQGYSLPEPIDVEYEDYDIEISHQEIYRQQASIHQNTSDTNNSQLNQDRAQINIQATPSPYLSISTSSQWQVNQITAPSNQIAQEIVVDDTDIFADNILEAESSQIDKPKENKVEKLSTSALVIGSQKIEDLPTPQLYIAPRQLISGKLLNVRVRLPAGNSHLAIKLWLEDCQTRNLLDGPHLLTNLTPNKNQELEVITKLNIPFGCLEVRLEAVAINRSTQQESHKFTIQRTVIPPDLPNIQLDAVLGM